jgi:hypothetical protein
VVVEFYRQIPQAVLRAIIAHMKLTDPNELDQLLASDRPMNDWQLEKDKLYKNCPSSDHVGSLQRRKAIPLTPGRIEFLIRLLDRVPKPV